MKEQLPQDVVSKIRTEAQNRYGDKSTSQHHEQACYMAGAETWANKLIEMREYLQRLASGERPDPTYINALIQTTKP